jgi:hypothetical protein
MGAWYLTGVVGFTLKSCRVKVHHRDLKEGLWVSTCCCRYVGVVRREASVWF